jgi:DNA phosphorothioation-dependent restriction protein DptH
MSNLFYNYLSKQVIEYLNARKVKNGDKFSVQFEKEVQVDELYKALMAYKTGDFIYHEASYETYYLQMNGIRLIVSATINNIQPDFLTRLRNKVGTEEVAFVDTAILFIHNTSLDSIIRGTESLQKEGMPLHIKAIMRDIKERINSSHLSKTDKFVISFDLDRKGREIFEDNTSIFEYRDILNVLNGDGIQKEQYKNFGLFFDPGLAELNKKEAEKRLEENYNFFSRVDSIHKYGNPDSELEKYFDEKGIDLLKGSYWREKDFKDVKNSAENKIGAKPLEYEKVKLSEELTYWDRAEGETKVKSRIRNIIIFNSLKLKEINLELSFDDYVRNEFISVINNAEAGAVAAGKKIRVKIQHQINTTGFSKITYKDNNNVKFEFRITTVECDEKIFEQMKTNFSVIIKGQERYILSNTDDEEIVINPSGDLEVEDKIDSLECIFEIFDAGQKLKLSRDIKQNDDDIDIVKITIKYLGVDIPLAVREQSEKPTTITGMKVWKLKRESMESFNYVGNNKLIQGTKEYFTRDEYRKNLEREKAIIEAEGLFFKELGEVLKAEELEVSVELKSAYRDLVQYYKFNNLLPSLAYYNDELLSLSIKYVNEYLKALKGIEKGTYLTQKQKDLTKVGVIVTLDGDNEMLFSPLHPLNIAYQIMIYERMGNEELSDEILKKLSSVYLVPYLYNFDGRIYRPIEQAHSPEWTYFVDQKMPRYKGSRNFVSKLVREKIEEFVDHFSYLFDLTRNSPININLINVGDCKEVLQGIFDYYTRSLNENPKVEDLIPISINIYGEDFSSNVFEEISFYNDPKHIKETFEVNLNTEMYTEEDVLNIFREKVHFFKKNKTEESYEYCHITFYEMDNDIQIADSNMGDINTGISLEGLVSGVPSVYLGDSYRTGFGTKYMKEGNDLLVMASSLNALTRVVTTGAPFDDEKCITTAIFDENKKSLDKIYDSSHWVTFIDPKVDLNFFKNDIAAKDLLIIHYSDQYTSSSGYDAITVTRKSNQYQMIIEEFLESKGIQEVEKFSPKIINFFNAVNGDWLLRLISSKSQFPREKLSILSAIKVSLAYFYHKNITWIPISLEEILRVSGGAGLTKANGFFSVKNLGGKGAYSDDLLLVGIEEIDGNIKVHYYPVEVKIGHNTETVINKAVEQAKKTRQLLEENFIETEEDSSKGVKAIYRNFLMQLVIVSAEKMKLYEIWNEQDWDKIIDSDVRRKLLNDEFEISSVLDKHIGRGAVISFKKDIYFNNPPVLKDDVYVLEFTENDGYVNIIKDVEGLKNKFIGGESDFEQEKLLYNLYKPEGTTPLYDPKVDPDPPVDPKPKPMEILFGHNASNNQPVKWYPTSTDKVMHTNTGIIGTMGTGKTQFTKSLITQLHKNSVDNVDKTKIGILIFDYKGDYIKSDFAEVTNANIYQLYHLPYNPLSLSVTENSKPLLPLHTASALTETIGTAFNLGSVQRNLLKNVIVEAYEERGINKANRETWTKPAPTMRDVYRIYSDKEGIKEDSLFAALTTIHEFEIFEPDPLDTKPLFDIIEGITVINLSGYDESIQNLVVAITLDLFYAQMQMAGHSKIEGNFREITRMVLVDEADNFLSKDFKALKKILKEGREFGVGTILSTQLLSHFSTADNDYANYILTWVVHNVADLNTKDIKYIFNTQNKEEEANIYNKIKKLEKHYSLVKLGGENVPIHVRDKAFWELVKETEK